MYNHSGGRDPLTDLANGSESPFDFSEDVFDGIDLFSSNNFRGDPSGLDRYRGEAAHATSSRTPTTVGSSSASSRTKAKDPILIEAKLGPTFFKVNDPEKMSEIDQFRVDYQMFRMGEPHGTKVEPKEIMKDLSDDDDEDEDDEEGDGFGKEKSSKRRRRTKEENKALHKAVERKRTRKINELIARLKSEMEMQSRFVKKDKASILAATLIYVQDLQEEVSSLKRERDSLILQVTASGGGSLPPYRPSPLDNVVGRRGGGGEGGRNAAVNGAGSGSFNGTQPAFRFSSNDSPNTGDLYTFASVKPEPNVFTPNGITNFSIDPTSAINKNSVGSLDYSFLVSPSFVNSPINPTDSPLRHPAVSMDSDKDGGRPAANDLLDNFLSSSL